MLFVMVCPFAKHASTSWITLLFKKKSLITLVYRVLFSFLEF